MSPEVLDLLAKAGPTGVVVLLFVLGYIVPKPTMDGKEREIEYLKQALADERAGRQAEREKYRLENATANAASLEVARTTEHLLTEFKARQGEVRS